MDEIGARCVDGVCTWMKALNQPLRSMCRPYVSLVWAPPGPWGANMKPLLIVTMRTYRRS